MGCCSKEKQEEKIIDKTVHCAYKFLYPVFVVKIKDLLQMTKAEPHQVLREKGICVQYKPGMKILFLSHQWIGNNHPDHTFEQMGVLLHAINNMIKGRIRVETDVISQLFFAVSASMTKEEMDTFAENYVWYDYFGIPQMVAAADSEKEETLKNLKAAVATIPAYIACADFFLILTPPCEHWQGHIVDYASWANRGWCRLEQTAQIMLHKDVQPMICVKSPDNVEFKCALDWMYNFPAAGDFTVDSDRDVVNNIVEEMLQVKLRDDLESGSTDEQSKFIARWFNSMRFRLLCKNGHDKDITRTVTDQEMDTFLQEYKFTKATDEPKPYCLGPLFFALLEGDLAMCDKLKAKGAISTGAKIKEGLPGMFLTKGSDLGHVVTLYTQGIPECRWLAEKGGNDMNFLNGFKYTTVASCKKPELFQWFVEECPGHKKESLDCRDTIMGGNILEPAIFMDCQKVCELAIEKYGVQCCHRNYFGRNCLWSCMYTDNGQLCDLLIRNGCDVMFQVIPPTFTLGGILQRLGKMTVKSQKDMAPIMMKWLGNFPRSTALHYMAFMNAPRCTHVILKNAKQRGVLKDLLNIRNDLGCTPLDLATSRNAYQVIGILQNAEEHLKDPENVPLDSDAFDPYKVSAAVQLSDFHKQEKAKRASTTA